MSSTLASPKTRVDVWNASYMPLGNAKFSRAMALVIDGHAVIEEADDSRIIKTADGTEIPFPKVIRLLKYRDVPFNYQEEFFSRNGVLRRDNHTCGYCGISGGYNEALGVSVEMTHDHILPRSRGGADSWINAITACKPCNWKKADRTPEEAGMKLLFPPRIPMRIYLRSEKPRKRNS